MYAANVENGTASISIPDLKEGNYTAKVTYCGDDKYDPVSADVAIEVEDSFEVIAPDVVKYFSGPERFNVYVLDNGKGVAGEDVSITINGVTYIRTTDENGTASLALNIPSGNYTYVVEVKVADVELNASVIVKPTIYADDVVKVYRNGTQYYALFLDGEGNPLVDTNVSFNIHGVFYNRTTNGTGWARLNINLEKGEYILTAINPVTGEMKTNNITVLSNLETSDLTKYYKNESQFVARVLTSDGSYAGAGESVKFNINGVFYTRTTNATGHVELNINLAPGEYVITSYYGDCAESNNIKVLPVLSADDLVMSYKDGSQFTAHLLDGEGNAYAGQTVAFNVHGILYNRTTDSNGDAKLNINLMSGEYIITSSYNGANIANTIKIS